MSKAPASILVVFLLLSGMNSFSQNYYHVKGEIKGASGHKFYLFNLYGGLQNSKNSYPIDSLIALKDTFSFHGTIDETQFYSLAMDSSEWFIPFIIDTGKVLIFGNADSFPIFRIRGSWENEVLRSFGNSTNVLVAVMNEAAANKNTTLYKSNLNSYLDSILAFTKRYPNSYGIFYKASNFSGDEGRFPTFGKEWFPLISDKLKNSTKGKQLFYIIYKYSADSFIGKSFPTIQTFDTTKKETSFSLNPQYNYLIDYWASWCIPCIEKLPNLKKIYHNHKSENFEIVSLSIDVNFNSWVKAVTKYEIPWENYSSLNDINSVDAKLFNIHSVPYTILVGKDNKIIKINPTEEEIEAFLSKR